MPITFRKSIFVGLAIAIALVSLRPMVADDPTPATNSVETPPEEAAPAATPAEVPRVSVEAARVRANLIYDIYSATLDTMHHRYFHGDRAVVPARAMEDMFEELERQQHAQARWISASFGPMSIDHEPKSEFEKQAAKKIAKGQHLVETIEDGYYRRAGSISLTSGCISCHSGLFAGATASEKFAGLIISIPVLPDARLETVAATEQP